MPRIKDEKELKKMVAEATIVEDEELNQHSKKFVSLLEAYKQMIEAREKLSRLYHDRKKIHRANPGESAITIWPNQIVIDSVPVDISTGVETTISDSDDFESEIVFSVVRRMCVSQLNKKIKACKGNLARLEQKVLEEGKTLLKELE